MESALAHLIQVDDRLPELILQFVEVPHAHFSEVTGMVFVEIRSVMMLSTGHTTATRMLPVFANAAMASGDVTATGKECVLAIEGPRCFPRTATSRYCYMGSTHCLRVLVSRVGIIAIKR